MNMKTNISDPLKHTGTVLCTLADLIADSGVCALLDGEQVALFYLPEQNPPLYALGNHDPHGHANVLSRGIIGDLSGELVVASPLYKHHYALRTGKCIEAPELSVPVYKVALRDNLVICE